MAAFFFGSTFPAQGGEEAPELLVLLEGKASERIEAPEGARVWELFGEGDRLAAVVSLPVSARHLLDQSDYKVRTLDQPPPGEELFLVTSPRGTDLSRLLGSGEVIWADTHLALVRTSQESADRLAGEGMEIVAVLPPPRRSPPCALNKIHDDPPGEDPVIRGIIDEIDQDAFYWMIGNLSGENPVTIDGSPYTILTRNS